MYKCRKYPRQRPKVEAVAKAPTTQLTIRIYGLTLGNGRGRAGKEERVRSETGEASKNNQPIRSYQVEGPKILRKIANQISPLPIDHVTTATRVSQSGPAGFITCKKQSLEIIMSHDSHLHFFFLVSINRGR